MLEINEIIENEDGSATVSINLDAETLRILLNKAFNDILLDAVNKEKEKNNDGERIIVY